MKDLLHRIKSEEKDGKGRKICTHKIDRVNFSEQIEKLQANGKPLLFMVIVAAIVMVFAACVVFFLNLRGAEQVLVPNVAGKELASALLELQEKELYPRIQLRYSDSPDDAGTILEQSPRAGAIVKGYSRVSLVVSRGVIIDRIDNYVGQKIDDVRIKLQTLFAGYAHPLIIIEEPQYKPDVSDAGTIIAQNPPAGTNISAPTSLHLIVSSGQNSEMVKIPNLVGNSVSDVLKQLSRNRLIFDFKSHVADDGERAGTVVFQELFTEEYVDTYTRVAVEFAFPSTHSADNVYGIFSAEISEQPFAVPVILTAYPTEGRPYVVATFNHIGGNLSVPYAVSSGTTLTLNVSGVDRKSIIVDGGSTE